MVDVSGKAVTVREATAEASLIMREETWRLISTGGTAKGDVLAAARLAGIQGAKKDARSHPPSATLSSSAGWPWTSPIALREGERWRCGSGPPSGPRARRVSRWKP